jgi:hypothetical protein
MFEPYSIPHPGPATCRATKYPTSPCERHNHGANLDTSPSNNTHLVDVRQDTTTGNGRPDQQVELFVSPDGELQVARRDTLDAKILGGVACESDLFTCMVNAGTLYSRHGTTRVRMGNLPASSRTSAVRYSMMAAT